MLSSSLSTVIRCGRAPLAPGRRLGIVATLLPRVKETAIPSALEQSLTAIDRAALAGARWFAGKRRSVAAVELADALEVPDAPGALLVVAAVRYEDGGAERYLLPSRLDAGGLLTEAGADDPLWPAVAGWIASGGKLGAFAATPAPAGTLRAAGPGRALTDDQSNTSVVLGERVVVKCYRRLERGPHPEPELLFGLSSVGSRRAPAFGGSLALRSPAGDEALVTLYAYVPGEPVGWDGLIDRLCAALAARDAAALAALAAEAGALGAAAAELHRDLRAAFGGAPATAADTRAAAEAARAQLAEAVAVADEDTARLLEDRASAALAGLGLLEGTPLTRLHGDLHLAQLLRTPDGPVAVDFEGEPGRTLAERRRPGSPLRDLACLLLSLDHAACAAARRFSFGPALDAALAWSARAREVATAAYASGAAGAGIAVDERLLRALEVEKECRELIYAATVLPEWSYAPRLTLPRLLGEGRA